MLNSVMFLWLPCDFSVVLCLIYYFFMMLCYFNDFFRNHSKILKHQCFSQKYSWKSSNSYNNHWNTTFAKTGTPDSQKNITANHMQTIEKIAQKSLKIECWFLGVCIVWWSTIASKSSKSEIATLDYQFTILHRHISELSMTTRD